MFETRIDGDGIRDEIPGEARAVKVAAQSGAENPRELTKEDSFGCRATDLYHPGSLRIGKSG
jgi:hypothetical protein